MEQMLSDENLREQMAIEAVQLAEMLRTDEILKQWQEIIRRCSL